MQNFNLEGSDDEYVSLIRKLKESGTEAVASKAFFLQPDAAFQDDGLSPWAEKGTCVEAIDD